MNQLAHIGHNGAPTDPIDDITAAYEAERLEAENWLDGTPVTDEAQMLAVDALREAMRQMRLALERGQKAATAPLHEAYKAELDRWKPTLFDAKLIEDGLVKLVQDFKARLDAEKEAARRAAEALAREEARKAQEAARAADAGNIEAARAAQAQIEAAQQAQRLAQEAAKDTVKGMRRVTRYEITDHRAALHDIAANDRAAMTEFIEEYVRRNHKARTIAGVRVWEDRVAV